uniref:Corticotropin-releasing factor domain-containing protein n=1 Tax=Chelydra serpentina TaxID=8475 RepID=A0A8C3RLD7_CHESE
MQKLQEDQLTISQRKVKVTGMSQSIEMLPYYPLPPKPIHPRSPETRWALLEESAKRTLSLLPSLSHNKAMIVKKSSPGTKFSLSLDVPTHILKILIELAKAKQLRAKAAANAELMAQIGRRK